MRVSFENRLNVSGKDLVCSLDIEHGKAHLLSGDNGVGKTTLLTFLKIHQDEFFPGKKVVFVDQYPLLPLNSVSFCDLKSILADQRHEHLSKFSEVESLISPFTNQSVKTLSGGQNQIVKLVLALYLSGDIFFLDEPLQFLDEEMRSKVKSILKELKRMGKTLIIVEHLKDFEVGFIDVDFFVKAHQDTIVVSNGI